MKGEKMAVAQSEKIYQELNRFQNVTAEPLYSTKRYMAPMPLEVSFFPGGTDKTKTNVVKAREIPRGHLTVIEEIRVSFSGGDWITAPDAPVLMRNFLTHAVLKFAPNEDARPRYFPLYMLGAGGGVTGFFQQAAPATENLATLGNPQHNAVFKLRKPEVIRGIIPFVCSIVHQVAFDPPEWADVMIVLAGYYAYPAARAAE